MSRSISRATTMTRLGATVLVLVVFASVAAKASVIPIPVASGLDRKFQNLQYNEDADLTTRQLIDKYGYRGETHKVTTEDGYILEMHRITGPRGVNNSNPAGKEPVLLMHGILSSSVDWVITGPQRAFGYALADEGYDVWLGNIRGNTYCRRHKKYTVIDKQFWKFSWHEIAIRDLPAMIDYVLEKTGKPQLVYAGHSQGTTDFWVMSTERPEYQKKVKAMFALAPVAYLTHIKSPFYQILARFGDNIEKMMSALGHYEFEPTSELVKEITSIACDGEASTAPMCMNLIFLVAGFSSDQLNKTMLPAILGHVPAGASVRQVVHYAQVINSRRFQQYDHGLLGNLWTYKRPRPPTYDLSKIKVPVYLHYSSSDWFSNPMDVDRLSKELGNVAGNFRVPHDAFAHLDFMWASDGRQLLYNKIIALMEKYRH